jgi:hypothetical protein
VICLHGDQVTERVVVVSGEERYSGAASFKMDLSCDRSPIQMIEALRSSSYPYPTQGSEGS